MGKRMPNAKKEETKSEKKKDSEILQEVLERLYKGFKRRPSQVKVGDILKVIELKLKLKATGGDRGQKALWELINNVRQEEIPKREKTNEERESSKKEVKRR